MSTTARQSSAVSLGALTSHVARTDLLGLFHDGDVDYKRVASITHLTKDDISKLGKVSKASVRFDADIPLSVAQRLRELANVANLIAEYFNGDATKVGLWFELPNPLLGNVSPRNMIRLGRYDRLLNFVLDAREAEHSATNAMHQRDSAAATVSR